MGESFPQTNLEVFTGVPSQEDWKGWIDNLQGIDLTKVETVFNSWVENASTMEKRIKEIHMY